MIRDHHTKAHVKLSVQASAIHGRGLFAGEEIKKGTHLGELTGTKTTKDSMYTLWLDEQTGFYVRCHFKYINHSAKPNVAYYDDLTVVALRDIAKGSELVHNYDGDTESE